MSPLISLSNVPKKLILCCGLWPISLLEWDISRAPKKGLVDKKGACVGDFPSAADCSSKPNGRVHIDVTM